MNSSENIQKCATSLFGGTIIKDHFQTVFVVKAILHVLFSVAEISLNGLVIVTILRSQNLQTPSYLLITSLAFTDLFMGILYHPFFAVVSIVLASKEKCTFRDEYFLAFYDTVFYFGSLSLIISAFISIDRYLALSLRHRYRIHVTKKRVCLVIVIGWIANAIFFITLKFLKMSPEKYIFRRANVEIATLFFTLIVYILLLIKLYRYTLQVQAQQLNLSNGSFDIVKYKRTLKTMVAILVCYVVCCAPAVFVITGHEFLEEYNDIELSLYIIGYLTFGAISFIDPIIYLTRFKDIPQECKTILNKMKFFGC